MSEIYVYRPATTVNLATTGTSDDYVAPNAQIVRVASNRRIHIKLGAAATTDDMFIGLDSYVFISLAAGESLNVIKATGETDGNTWITEVVES